MLHLTLFVFCNLGLSFVVSLTWEPRNFSDWPDDFDKGTQNAFYKMRLSESSNLLYSNHIVDDIYLRNVVKFFLFTRSNKYWSQQLFVDDVNTLSTSYFNKSRPTKFIIHGYINDVNSKVIQNIKKSFLENYDYNVIAVDWGFIANTVVYILAAGKTQMVGKYLGEFIEFLVKNEANIKDFHLIGHSLGAHVAGFAGKSVTSGKIPRITGLDPAKPWFTNNPQDQRLDKTDAKFVDCIHTCGGYLGFMEPICHVDFYPNGGVYLQPGCGAITLGICSHSRSHEYFAESIMPTHKFFSYKCKDIPRESSQECTTSNAVMGFHASLRSNGVYYLETRSSFPFSLNITTRYRMKIL